MEIADPDQAQIAVAIRELVDKRHQIEVEYFFHRLAHLWLLVHGPAAWALFVLLVEHIVMSIWYGGF